MKFFTDEQKFNLMIVSGGGVAWSTFMSCVGNIVGSEAAHFKAYYYAKDAGCEKLWLTFHEIYLDQNATAVCGEICANVCESASGMLSGIANNTTLGFAISAAIITVGAVGTLAYRYHAQNKTEPEFQSLNEEHVNYSV